MLFRSSGGKVIATGLRNSAGFDWRPGDGALFATDNGRDLLGDDFPPCELNRIEEGGFYGWPFVNGLSLSGDGQWIATGTKSLDTSLVRADDGRAMWTLETQSPDAVLAPDGRHLATFGGHVLRAVDGALAGMAKIDSVTRFTPDGRALLKFGRSLALHDLGGKLLRDFGASGLGPGSGEQAQWAYLTRDGRYAIMLGRDMAAPPQVGIAIYERQIPSAAATAPTIAAAPLAQTAALGRTVTLAVTANGTAPLAFQWRKNGADLPGRN